MATAGDQRRIIRMPDGRDLGVVDVGRSFEDALVFYLGAPGGAVAWRRMVAAAAARNLRYLCIARPGNGRSTRQPDRTVADAAADLRAVATRLGLRRLYVVGHSSGGPPALAAAALLPDLVAAAAAVASRAPHRERGVNAREELGDERYLRAIEGPELAVRCEAAAPGMPRRAADVRRMFQASESPADAALADGDQPAFLAAQIREGFRNGIWGWHDDMRSEIRDWGFDLESIRVPVAVWHGTEDPLVPVAHGRWLADHLAPGPHHILDHDGHGSIMVNHLDDVIDQLLELAAP